MIHYCNFLLSSERTVCGVKVQSSACPASPVMEHEWPADTWRFEVRESGAAAYGSGAWTSVHKNLRSAPYVSVFCMLRVYSLRP